MSALRPTRPVSQRTATLAALGAIFFWCWSGVCFTQGARLMGAMHYLALMTAAGSLTVVGLQALQRRNLGDLCRLPPRVMFSGFLGVAVYTILLALAFGRAPAADIGQVNLLNYLWPIWIVLLAMVFLKERPRPLLTVIGTLLGFGGVAVARGLNGIGRLPADPLPHLMALAGAFMFALYCVLLRYWRIPEEAGGTAFHFAGCALTAAFLAPILDQPGSWAAAARPQALFWVLFGGIGPVGLGYHWWELGVKRGSLYLITVCAYFTPIGSSLLLGLFFRQALTPGLILGAALITLGAGIVHRASAA